MEYSKGENSTDKEIATMECGCVIFQRTSLISGGTRALIQYCPFHASAHDMYEALKRFLDSSACTNGCDPDDMTCDTNFARKAIAKAEGKHEQATST